MPGTRPGMRPEASCEPPILASMGQRPRLPPRVVRNLESLLARNRCIGRFSMIKGRPTPGAELRMDSESRHEVDAVVVRNSRDADVAAMLAIYLHHIRAGVDPRHEGEIETPDADDLKRRRKSMQRRKMPHIVAEERSVVLGYAYAVPFRKRPAYRYTVKHSIYVHNSHLHRGIGRLLLAALLDAADRLQIRALDGFGDGAALARAGFDGAAGGVGSTFAPAIAE